MTNRFLYGDSEPFPETYDFLASLRAYVSCAAQCLALEHEADLLERSLGEQAQSNLRAQAALEGYFAAMMELASERAVRSPMPAVVGPFANQLIEHIEGLSAHATKGRAEELDATTMRAMADVRQQRDEMKKALSAWLTADPLPVRSWALSLELAGTAPHGQVVLEHPGEISSAFLVDATRDVGWGRPRRVGDLVAGMTVQVGFKKAFLRSSLQPDVAALDELVIAAAEIGPDSAEIHLRRRLDQPRDSYVLAADPQDDGAMSVRVTRFEQKGEDSAPYLSEGDDKARILELVSVVRRESRSLLGHKKRLLSLQIDGHDVFEQGLVATLFSRVAARMRPLAVEIERRSPSRAELSLKVEKADGRREEIYLKKAELAALVQSLPAELHPIFHGLAIFGETEGVPRSASVVPPAPTAAAPAAVPSAMPRPSQMPPPKRRA